jgi:16S rRNA G527 N7-methylase RsmG
MLDADRISTLLQPFVDVGSGAGFPDIPIYKQAKAEYAKLQ